MQIQTMETSISGELMEDEELLWSGRPDPQGRSVVSPARVFLIIGWIYLPLGLVLLIVGFILLFVLATSSASGAFLGAMIPGGVFFLIGLIFLIIGLVAHFPARNVFYAITSRRVIILRTGRYLRAVSYGKRAITQVQRFERHDGSGDLIFSGNAFSYGNTTYGNHNSAGYSFSRQGAFTAIPNVRAAEQKLLSMLYED